MKPSFKYIFVILVYKNSYDLEACLKTIILKVKDFKVIVVNAYFDDATKQECQRIAIKYSCDFINIENKGYSYGNNQGIDYALRHYDFKYLIISNPDIEILSFDDYSLDNKFDIIAPNIITLSGKSQNPMALKRNKISEFMEYYGFKNNNRGLIYAGIIFSKIARNFFSIINKIINRKIFNIYCAHGSFVIFSKIAINKLLPVYDENMFLFGEEGTLAIKASRLGLKCCYYDLIKVLHKEDGSMKLSDFSINDILRESNIYYYENYVKK